LGVIYEHGGLVTGLSDEHPDENIREEDLQVPEKLRNNVIRIGLM
jgi:hypothetical protein